MPMHMAMAASTSASLSVVGSGFALHPHHRHRHHRPHLLHSSSTTTRLRNNRFFLSSSLAFSPQRYISLSLSPSIIYSRFVADISNVRFN